MSVRAPWASEAASSECRLLWSYPSSRDNWQKTIRAADECAALPGLSAEQRAGALVDSAEIRSLLGDYAGAEEILKRALRLKPSDADALILLAKLSRDRPEQALRHAASAASAAGAPRKKAAAYRLAGEILIDLGDKAGAQSNLAQALKLAGEDIEALRAMVWANQNNPGPASAYARRACKAAEAAPGWQRVAAYRLCAQVLIDIGDYSGAVAVLRRALAIEPDDLKALRLLLQIKHQHPQEALPLAGIPPEKGQAADAETQQDPEHPLAADPDDLEALRVLIARKRAENRVTEAVALADRFTAGVRKAPSWQQVDAYRLSAKIWVDLGDIQKARSSLQRAEELNVQSAATGRLFSLIPSDPPIDGPAADIYQHIADARLELGDPAGAQASLERALKLAPDNLKLLQLMVQFHLSQGKPDKALASAQRLLAASEKASVADMVKGLPNDVLIPSFPKDGPIPDQSTIRIYLKNADVADRARKMLDKHRRVAMQMMAAAQLALNHPKEALAWSDRLMKSLEKAPPAVRADIYRQRAEIQSRLKDAAGEEGSLRRAFETEPERSDTLQKLAQFMLDAGNPQEALTWSDRLVKIIEKAPSSIRADVYRQRARIQSRLNDEAGVEESLGRALELEPEHAEMLQELAQLKLDARTPKEALAWSDRLIKALEKAPPSIRVEAYRQRAEIQNRLKDASGAEESLRRALELEPGHAETLQGLSRLKLDAGNLQEALAWSDRLVKALGKTPPSMRADIYRQRAEIQSRLKDVAGAEESLGRAFELDPANAQTLQELARFRLGASKPREALDRSDLLIKALEKAPPSMRADIYRQRAEIQSRLKDEAGAEESLGRAFALEPGNAETLQALSRLKLDAGYPQEALAWSDRLVKASEKAPPSTRADIYRQRAEIQSRLKNEAGAEESLRRALELEPEHAETLQELSQLKLDAGKPEEALALLSIRRPSEPHRQARSLVLRGLARTMLKKNSQAREDFSAAVGLDPMAACFDELLTRDRGRFDLSYFDLCLGRFPEDSALHSDRGLARYLAGREEDALADFRKAIELKPDFIEAYLNLSSALALQHRSVEALAAAEKALSLLKDQKGPAYDQLVSLRDSLIKTGRAAQP